MTKINLPYFGRLTLNPASLKKIISQKLLLYKSTKSPILRDEILHLIQLYKQSSSYKKSKKFKLRFGNWHNGKIQE